MHESSSIVRPLNGTKVLRLDHFVVEESFHWKLSLSLSLVSNSFFFLLQNWTSHNVNKLARGTCWSQPQQMPPVGGREMTDSTQVEVRSHQTRHVQSKQTTLVATTWKMSTRMSPESKGNYWITSQMTRRCRPERVLSLQFASFARNESEGQCLH